MRAPVDVMEQFGRIVEMWSPRIIGQVNAQYVKIAKVSGTLAWHRHEDSDEMFFVLRGAMRIELEGRVVHLRQGDLFVVPKGAMHNPVADEECWILLVESLTTRHTGEITMAKTKTIEQQLG